MSIDKLKLLASVPISTDVCKVYPLIIKKDIVPIGEDKYYEYLGLLLLDISDFNIPEEDIKRLGLTSYDVIVINSIENIDFRKKIIKALQLFIKEEVNFYFDTDYAFFYIGDIKEGRVITLDIYNDIKSIIRQQNCVPEKDKYNPANKTADDFIKQMEEIKSKYKKYANEKKDSNITLYDLVSAVVWKGNRSYDEVLGYSIFQLYEALDRINIVDNYTFVMNGLYTGNIDIEESKKQLKDLNWIKRKPE